MVDDEGEWLIMFNVLTSCWWIVGIEGIKGYKDTIGTADLEESRWLAEGIRLDKIVVQHWSVKDGH